MQNKDIVNEIAELAEDMQGDYGEGMLPCRREFQMPNCGSVTAHCRYKNFGITPEKYADMLLAQKGKCAICGKKESQIVFGKIKSLSVDHCHKTGKVRGLLCSCCNLLLGQARDHIGILAKAIFYLKRHKGE